VYAMDVSGELWYFNGADWSKMHSPNDQLPKLWRPLLGVSQRGVVVASPWGTLHKENGTDFTTETTGPDCFGVVGVWSPDGNQVFAACAGGSVLHYDGRRWRSLYEELPYRKDDGSADDSYVYYSIFEQLQLVGIWGSSEDDIFVFGTKSYLADKASSFEGFVLHYDGTVWKKVVSLHGSIIDSAWGIGKGEVVFYAHEWYDFGGNDISFYRYDATGLTAESSFLHCSYSSSENGFPALFGLPGDEFYATPCGLSWYDGNAWQLYQPTPYGKVRGIFGFSDEDLYLVTAENTILHTQCD